MDKILKKLTNKQLMSLINNQDYVKLLAVAELKNRKAIKLPLPKVGDCIKFKHNPITWFIKITHVEDCSNIRGDEIMYNASNDEVNVCENVGYSADEIEGFEIISSEYYDYLLEAYNDFDEDFFALKDKFIEKFKTLMNV